MYHRQNTQKHTSASMHFRERAREPRYCTSGSRHTDTVRVIVACVPRVARRSGKRLRTLLKPCQGDLTNRMIRRLLPARRPNDARAWNDRARTFPSVVPVQMPGCCVARGQRRAAAERKWVSRWEEQVRQPPGRGARGQSSRLRLRLRLCDERARLRLRALRRARRSGSRQVHVQNRLRASERAGCM